MLESIQPDFDANPFEPCGVPFSNAGCILFLGYIKIGGMYVIANSIH